MTATENYLQQIGYNGDIDDLDGILDFINEQKHILTHFKEIVIILNVRIITILR